VTLDAFWAFHGYHLNSHFSANFYGHSLHLAYSKLAGHRLSVIYHDHPVDLGLKSFSNFNRDHYT
jgi:hypothetical protein